MMNEAKEKLCLAFYPLLFATFPLTRFTEPFSI